MNAIMGIALALIWSTAFLVGRIIVGHSEPLVFLTLRFGCAAAILFIALFFFKPARLNPKMAWIQLGIGALMNGVYVALCYTAMAHGLPAAIVSLIGGWQPVLTILVTAVILKIRPSATLLIVTGVSLVGLALVIVPRLGSSAFSLGPICMAFTAICLFTTGSLLQKRVATVPLVQAVAWQTLGAALTTGLLAAALAEPLPHFSVPFIAALVWSIVGISIGAMVIMVKLIRTTSATAVSLILLAAPPLAAVEEFFLFNATLLPVQIAGVACVIGAVGTVLVRQSRRGLAGA